ncbi:glycoside hydrolase family 172 protein [Cohnella sp. GCM10020058]|uniref:glycoside hydrolase family 172 protein n=1 Tax=Cohnella sp. GCM10020058 TaxID=3317330 RepID=UPI0036325927
MSISFDLSTIFQASTAVSRSISAENPTGEKGKGAMAAPSPDGPASAMGIGWKARPYITVKGGETVVLADIEGPGIVMHIWMTLGGEKFFRDLVLRFYWDGEEEPSVEVPYGDFFCNGWGVPVNVVSEPVNVNPLGGFNGYWPMPFRRSARITVENTRRVDLEMLFYQIDYALAEVPEDSTYFHAQWRRQNPIPRGTEYTIVDGISGKGRFAGVYLAWEQRHNRWWGEGEVKFYIDGDTQFPTYCGTGLEDYFGGAWGFFTNDQQAYEMYSAPYLGYHQLIKPDGFMSACMRHGLYRWHIRDPILFGADFKATVQPLGWQVDAEDKQKYLHLQDDVASTAFWYQSEPHAAFPPLPDRDSRDVTVK